MKHVVLVGACFVDTILSIPHFPNEDDKLRATGMQVRRGGNCPNALEVLAQLLRGGGGGNASHKDTATYLVAPLPAADAPATRFVKDSFGGGDGGAEDLPAAVPPVSLEHCLYRAGHTEPASCYALRAATTGSRTIVSHNALPEMTVEEFAQVADAIGRPGRDDDDDDDDSWWWHFEGRIPETTLACAQHLRRRQQQLRRKSHRPQPIVISVEVENPARPGLRALAAEADVVFYSRTWAETKHQGYDGAEACLRGEAPSLPHAKLAFCTWGEQNAAAAVLDGSAVRVFVCPTPGLRLGGRVVDTVGAGDTFAAGVLYRLASCQKPAMASLLGDNATPARVDDVDTDVQQTLAFAVALATRKVQQDGLQGLAGGKA